LNFISSQYSLQLGFASARLFHRLPHLWLSTVLLKVHHYISLRIPHFASHFAFIHFSSQPCVTLRVTSLFVTSLASHFGSFRFCHFLTHTHTLSLSLSFSLRFFYYYFVLVLRLSPSRTVSHLRLHITHLGFTSHTSASRHTLRLRILALPQAYIF
jgi:hypothetical protein